MFRIEMIPKKSTIEESLEYWEATGRENELPNGQFVFEDADYYEIGEGIVFIRCGEKVYSYNHSDFYRIKAIKKTTKGE